MSTSHHADIFLQARRSVGPHCAKMHDANNKRCIFRYGYRDASALPATKGDGAVTFTNEPGALIFEWHDQKKGWGSP
jgi:hypothetical protein